MKKVLQEIEPASFVMLLNTSEILEGAASYQISSNCKVKG
ncbi:hypothetical protein QNH23_16300 [Siminovitchia fortis]|nr:hypothetical protein [Siminovitchia fortis]WHY81416.1 hypothetical protein QNH23_16300 [Siminovitchia fortis]